MIPHLPKPDEAASESVGLILPPQVVERLRVSGYVVVPLRPSEEMVRVGAPRCFQPSEAQSCETWAHALSDATACYEVMVELGCL